MGVIGVFAPTSCRRDGRPRPSGKLGFVGGLTATQKPTGTHRTGRGRRPRRPEKLGFIGMFAQTSCRRDGRPRPSVLYNWPSRNGQSGRPAPTGLFVAQRSRRPVTTVFACFFNTQTRNFHPTTPLSAALENEVFHRRREQLRCKAARVSKGLALWFPFLDTSLRNGKEVS